MPLDLPSSVYVPTYSSSPSNCNSSRDARVLAPQARPTKPNADAVRKSRRDCARAFVIQRYTPVWIGQRPIIAATFARDGLPPNLTNSSLTAPAHPAQDLRRVIGLAGGTALIVGITIGSGIFRTPPTIARLVPHPLVIMGLWTAFGLISVCGALALAELSTMLPRAGGVSVFLREAYGDAAAFVFGWLCVLITAPPAVAALATVFGEFLLNLLGRPAEQSTVQAIAIAAITALTLANVFGARVGAAVSEVTTLVKVTALVVIILGAFLLGDGDASHFTTNGPVQGSGLARAVAAGILSDCCWDSVSSIDCGVYPAGGVVAQVIFYREVLSGSRFFCAEQ